jgi:uncharacterized protein YbcV (DUF1398 family)
MEASTQQTIEQCVRDSDAGITHYGAIVERLIQAGVESYRADYRQGINTYYLPSGETFAVPLNVPDVDIPQAFDADALKEAIRGAQRDEIKFPEFLHRSMAAGCVGYIVWITGRHVAYFGHRGEGHVEPFPD